MKIRGLAAILLAGCALAAAQSIATGPSESDMYCSGFITKDAVPTTNKLVAGWDTPNQAIFSAHDFVYLRGGSYQTGQQFAILRRTRDVSGWEVTKNQQKTLNKVGMQYAELGRVKVIDVQKNIGIAQVELSCDAFDLGDVAIPWAERPAVTFKAYPPINRFVPANGKTTGHIVMAQEYGGIIGNKDKVYLDIGSNQGLKPGDYLRATRTYEQTMKDETDSLGAKAAVPDYATYEKPKFIEPMPKAHEALKNVVDLPRRTLGEMIVLHTTPVSATAMMTATLEQVQIGDGVELMEEPPPPPPPPPVAAPMPPSVSCTADPASVTAGDTATIRANGDSPDNHPLTYTFAASQGSISQRENVATLTTAGATGNIAVTCTVTDDRNLTVSSHTSVAVQAPAAPPQASQAGDFAFLPNSARVDNKAKAILDGIALRMNREANSNVLVVGYSAVAEKNTLGLARANNSKTYLTKDKGIDAARVTTADGGKGGRRVEIWFVPAGAAMPAVTPVAAPAETAPAKPAAKKPAAKAAPKK